MTTEPSNRLLDLYDILEATRNAPRDKALKFREALLLLTRALEDMHGFPHSHQTKVERGEALPKTEHHNR